VLHPHVHGLVTGGGLHAAGPWVAVRHGFLWPVRVVMAVFRGTLRAAIHQGMPHGRLTPPAGRSRQPLEHRLNQRGRQKWHVPSRERYPPGQGVLVYLARDLRGGPLSNRRLRACDGQRVVLAYEERAQGPEGQARPRTMDLPLEPFLGRWLLHVPPAGAVRVRCWGLYAHTQGDALAQCRQPLGQGRVEAPEPLDGPREGEAWGEESRERCPVCGPPLVGTALLPRAGVPPPTEPGWEQVA
jgi:Putative transposase